MVRGPARYGVRTTHIKEPVTRYESRHPSRFTTSTLTARSPVGSVLTSTPRHWRSTSRFVRAWEESGNVTNAPPPATASGYNS